ncbi:MAG: SAM-dependent methyltransferase [Acidobacteriota bacterium]
MTESAPLAARLAERIRREGPLPFDAFQEAALYDPAGGYYERPGRVGRAGDFVTGPSWHPAFGRTIARIARRLREEEEKKEISAKRGEERGDEEAGGTRAPTDLVDVGAGEGELLAAADSALRAWGIREEFRLIGVERSAARRSVAAAKCPSAAWLSSFEEIPSSSLSGLVVCYELFDALPVRALFFDGEELLERRVTLASEGKFDWIHVPCPDADAILDPLRRRGIHLLRNQQLEIRPLLPTFAKDLGERLSRGLLLVFDYGAPARALYSAARLHGTLEAFHAHEVSRDVLVEPGSRDITAWVDFTELAESFASLGLDVAGPVSQARVLSAAGIGTELEEAADRPPSAARAADRNAIARLVAPGGMGESIRVLLASRGSTVKDTLLEWPRLMQSH